MKELKEVRTFILKVDEITSDKRLLKVVLGVTGDMPWAINNFPTFYSLKMFYDGDKFTFELPSVDTGNIHYMSGISTVKNLDDIEYLKKIIKL